MYRQGLGDCFLLSLPRAEGKPFRMLIDCGVILGTKQPEVIMTEVVDDIAAACEGHLDVVVVTHEHWDHISGFLQAGESFAAITVGEVWMPWTEDPDDALANTLREQRHGMVRALQMAEAQLNVAGQQFGANAARSAKTAGELAGILSFFGAAGQSTADAMETARSLGQWIVYCSPDQEAMTLDGVPARFYVLGPPRDVKLLKKTSPSSRTPETYEFGAMADFLAATDAAAGGPAEESVFGRQYEIPMPLAKELPLLKERYWGANEDGEGPRDQSWRRIDGTWLESAADMAIKLDNATNNTSLVLAIELTETGEVLLFVADAQVGNWLSWQDLVWEEAERTVTGPDLLGRATFYKVGHHGSHNATLREKGLAQMGQLQFAMLPVQETMAKQKGWNHMPLDALLKALKGATANRLIRLDKKVPAAASGKVKSTPLYHELTL
jgi:hypothetical protein